jgi:TolB-like protein
MHQLEPPNDLLFEGFLLRPQGLLRLDGTGNAEPVALGSRALDLLRLLVERQGEVVSKETILSTVWPGATVEESNLTVQIASLRRVLDRNHGRESKIQTIRGRGYRFTAAVSRGDKAAAPPLGAELPDKPSIAVLPFENLTGDPTRDYFADGMVEEIITSLSRIRWLFVIARSSSFTYKGQNVDVRQIGRELGVRYLLEGSVRRDAGLVRIAAQLIDTTTGVHIWGDRFDGQLEDSFALQDKVAFEVAGIIEVSLTTAEAERVIRRPAADPSACDLYLRAMTLSWAWSRESTRAALDLLTRAIRRDPNYGPALALASACQTNLHLGRWTDDPEVSRREATDLARRALRCAGGDAVVLGYAALTLGYFGEDIGASIALVDRALTLNPSFALGWGTQAWLKVWAGQPESALIDFATALRLSPREIASNWLFGSGIACFFVHRFAEAEAMLLRSLQGQPNWPPTYRFLAACYAHMGQLAAAHEAIEKLRQLTSVIMPAIEHWRRPEDHELYLSGLRLAAGMR